MLDASYRLRYQVYCHERHFLAADNYENGVECDEFDPYSIHVGAVNKAGELAGTARIVLPNALGFPFARYCTLSSDQAHLAELPNVVELSRLCVSRRYRRRRADGDIGVDEEALMTSQQNQDRRRIEGEVFLTVMKALYQTSKRVGIKKWLAATEKSLQRILLRFGFPFQQVGPESDYFGPVAPYVMDLREFEEQIASGDFPALAEFVMDAPTDDRRPEESGAGTGLVRAPGLSS